MKTEMRIRKLRQTDKTTKTINRMTGNYIRCYCSYRRTVETIFIC